jgi:hypothetical protein
MQRPSTFLLAALTAASLACSKAEEECGEDTGSSKGEPAAALLEGTTTGSGTGTATGTATNGDGDATCKASGDKSGAGDGQRPRSGQQPAQGQSPMPGTVPPGGLGVCSPADSFFVSVAPAGTTRIESDELGAQTFRSDQATRLYSISVHMETADVTGISLALHDYPEQDAGDDPDGAAALATAEAKDEDLDESEAGWIEFVLDEPVALAAGAYAFTFVIDDDDWFEVGTASYADGKAFRGTEGLISNDWAAESSDFAFRLRGCAGAGAPPLPPPPPVDGEGDETASDADSDEE